MRSIKILIAALALTGLALNAQASPGGLDQYGGHTEKATGQYHFHQLNGKKLAEPLNGTDPDKNGGKISYSGTPKYTGEAASERPAPAAKAEKAEKAPKAAKVEMAEKAEKPAKMTKKEKAEAKEEKAPKAKKEKAEPKEVKAPKAKKEKAEPKAEKAEKPAKKAKKAKKEKADAK